VLTWLGQRLLALEVSPGDICLMSCSSCSCELDILWNLMLLEFDAASNSELPLVTEWVAFRCGYCCRHEALSRGVTLSSCQI